MSSYDRSSKPSSVSQKRNTSSTIVSEPSHFSHSLFFVILILILLVGGVLGYFIYRFIKNKNDGAGGISPPAPSPPCLPTCQAGECGTDDGCGGTCTCKDPKQVCFSNKCCTPSCLGKQCGNSDGCGSTCPNTTCNDPTQVCYKGACCSPNCQGKKCGDSDECGGICTVQTCTSPASCYKGVCGPPFQGATHWESGTSNSNKLSTNSFMMFGDFLKYYPLVNNYIHAGLLNGRIVILSGSSDPVVSNLQNCFYLFLQPDGNLTAFDNQFNQIWSSDTSNQGVDSLIIRFSFSGPYIGLMNGSVQVKPIRIGIDI